MSNKDFLIKYIEDGDEVILRSYIGKEKIVKIPEDVTTIDKFAFANDVQSNDIIEKMGLTEDDLDQMDSEMENVLSMEEDDFEEEEEENRHDN